MRVYKRLDDMNDSRFKGIRIYLYNNSNGKYGFVCFGKEYDLFNISEEDKELANQLFSASENIFEVNNSAFCRYWYKVDIKEGIK